MSGNKRATGSHWAKVDAHVITPEEYEEAPEATDEDFARAELRVGGVLVRTGRPKSENAKQLVSLRLDQEVIAHFKKRGAGWQTRINAALRQAAKVDVKISPTNKPPYRKAKGGKVAAKRARVARPAPKKARAY